MEDARDRTNEVDNPLASWHGGDHAARAAIVRFVESVTQVGGPAYVPPEERIAVFDNDGTLWCEKPVPVELSFILQRLTAMAEQDASLRERQPWKAAFEHNHAWFDGAITKHYRGDEGDVKALMTGVLRAFRGVTVEAYAAAAADFLQDAPHATLGRRYRDCVYQPMIELLRYLEANGFTTFIASGGDRDFMRVITPQIYGIPPERVVGSSTALRYRADKYGGAVVYRAAPDVFDDGPAKPVRIWSRVGRRPILAAGNSNGDLPMLHYVGSPKQTGLRLLLLHDDEAREFAYVAGAEESLTQAKAEGWTVISIKNDWKSVFATPAAAATVS